MLLDHDWQKECEQAKNKVGILAVVVLILATLLVGTFINHRADDKEYQEQIEELEYDKSDLESQVEELQSEVEDLQYQIDNPEEFE